MSGSWNGVRNFYNLHPSKVASTQEGFLEEWAFKPDLKDKQDYTSVMRMDVGRWVKGKVNDVRTEGRCREG